MVRKSVTEILTEVGAVPTFAERVKALKSHENNAAVLAVLKHAYDPRIKFLLPEGKPPFKPNDFPDQQGLLYSQIRRFYLFVEGGHPGLKDLKREELFIAMLETIDQKDALTIVGMKDKKIPIKNITPKLAERAFPGLFE